MKRAWASSVRPLSRFGASTREPEQDNEEERRNTPLTRYIAAASKREAASQAPRESVRFLACISETFLFVKRRKYFEHCVYLAAGGEQKK